MLTKRVTPYFKIDTNDLKDRILKLLNEDACIMFDGILFQSVM